MSMLLNTAIKGIFTIYICKLSVYGHKSNFILTFLLEGALCIKYIKFSISRATSWAFGVIKE